MVGELDITPLMVDALCMFNLGGWSDAIKKVSWIRRLELHLTAMSCPMSDSGMM